MNLQEFRARLDRLAEKIEDRGRHQEDFEIFASLDDGTWHPIEPKFHDFRIVSREPHGHNAEIWLDGQKLKGVRSYSVSVEMNDVNVLRVEFIAGSINKEEA